MRPRKPFFITLVTVFLLIFGTFYMFLQNFSFLSSPIFLSTLGIAAILTYINESISKLIELEKFKTLNEEEKAEYLRLLNMSYWQRLRDSAIAKQSEKQEKELIIDHGFDGILELDNSLPKWWVGLFYFGVAYMVIYMIAFFTTDFAHPDVEYDVAYLEQKAAIAEYEKNAPQVTIDNAKFNPDFIEEGKTLFNENCKSCHMEGGAGGIGPNLTDDYWINIEQQDLFKNIFHLVWNGSKNNPAMRAFGESGELKGNQIEKIASYVVSINQSKTKPANGSAPQGQLAPWAKK